MPRFGAASRAHLQGVHPDLVRLFEAVVAHYDCTITDGVRTVEEQRKNVAKGVSKTMASKHLPQSDGLGHALDVMPYPHPPWPAIQRGLDAMRRADPEMGVARCYHFIGFVMGMAAAKGIPIRQGADWDSDELFHDHSFIDLPHFELDR
jgi:peptidoglycan L-alanyl-D-glutamate endopeptidase CwlK